jgi:hypothetical protein
MDKHKIICTDTYTGKMIYIHMHTHILMCKYLYITCHKQHGDDNTNTHLPILHCVSSFMLPNPHSDQILPKFPAPHKKSGEPTLSYLSRIFPLHHRDIYEEIIWTFQLPRILFRGLILHTYVFILMSCFQASG